jgi:hypothetical protein
MGSKRNRRWNGIGSIGLFLLPLLQPPLYPLCDRSQLFLQLFGLPFVKFRINR